MDLAGRLQQLEDVVRDAKSMPLSSSALLNRDEVIEMIQEMRESLPEEIKQARWIVKDREELLAKARQEAERIVDQAREDQLRMARKGEVVQRAEEEADRIVAEAQQQADDGRVEAETYVDARLAQFEIALRRILEESQGANRALAKTLDQIEIGRERLRAPTTAAEQEFGGGDEPEGELFDEEAR